MVKGPMSSCAFGNVWESSLGAICSAFPFLRCRENAYFAENFHGEQRWRNSGLFWQREEVMVGINHQSEKFSRNDLTFS
jgi:hypothetical protein